MGSGRKWLVYFEKIRVFKAGFYALNMLAWNNNIGLWFYLLVVRELE